MKNTILAVITVLLSQTLSAQTYTNVSSEEFKKLIESGKGVLVDVRTPGEYSRGHIKGATLIDVSKPEAGQKIGALSREKAVYLYCLSGSRSRAIANSMIQAGFKKVYNLQYGIIEWNRMQYPLVRSNTVIANASKTYSIPDFNQLIQSNKLVLIDFYAPWCAPCNKMAPDIAKLKSTYAGKALIEKVDVEANKSLQTTYKVPSIPGLLLFKNGKEVWRHTGAMNYEELDTVMKKYL